MQGERKSRECHTRFLKFETNVHYHYSTNILSNVLFLAHNRKIDVIELKKSRNCAKNRGQYIQMNRNAKDKSKEKVNPF